MVVPVRMDQTKYSSGRRFDFFIFGGSGNVEYLIVILTPLNSDARLIFLTLSINDNWVSPKKITSNEYLIS
jgi:hypothetical protein